MNWVTNHRFKAFIAMVAIGALLLLPFSVVQAAGGWMYILKEFSLDVVARIFARTVLSRIEGGIVGKILNAGRDGGPAFIQDWRQFTQSAQYRGEDIFRAMLANATTGTNAQICQYMRTSLSNIFGAKSVFGFNPNKYRVDSLQPFILQNKCSLPSGFNVETFRNDFSKGGSWDAWGKLIQPQNNFYGVFGNSLSELTKQRGFEEKIDVTEALSGEGHTSKRENCKGEGMNKQCAIMGLVITPATVFSDSEKTTINRELDWLVSADELSEVIAGATYALLDRLENFAASKATAVTEAERAEAEPSYNYSEALERAQQEQEMFENYVAPPTPEETTSPEEIP